MITIYSFIIISIFLVSFVIYYFSQRDIFQGEIKNKNFENPSEKRLNFLWSRGLEEKNEYMLEDTKHLRKDLILNQINTNIVWIRTTSKKKEEYCDLDFFAESLDKIKENTILVTSDGDKSIPSDLKEETFNKIINHPNIKKWYTQNYDGTVKHRKLKNYPIGFDLHTNRTIFGIVLKFLPPNNISKKINYLIESRIDFNKKKRKIFIDVHLKQHKKFNNERKRVKDILSKSNNCDFLKLGVDQKAIWRKYSNHKFVISAFGNGLDCHRTWECLFLGCIVIVKKSSLDYLYKDLPVVILDDWDECLDSKNLEKWEKEYSHLTDFNHLDKFFTYDYWIK